MNKIIASFVLLSLALIACKDDKKIEESTIQEHSTEEKIKSLKVSKITEDQLPNAAAFQGIFKEAYEWEDMTGKNVAILSETGIFRNSNIKHENDGSDAELFAYSYRIEGEMTPPNWKVYDYIRDCPVDIVAEFIDNTFQITDLDKNGIAEVWMMYKTDCHGDVSPSDMKIIMYEGYQKFAMRGENKIEFGRDDDNNVRYVGGEYKFDEAFLQGPEAFRKFAKQLWNKNIMAGSK
ncbi:M949_RS01915 family surface polysaccharide biosynthesis protein [Soonwooa sp.]|uniref:M949_RS01915 family surface polysaccharide biosynthesis protein n=1 Tax=Soonwooa sp. TaxID=1938592 RepID=UPI0026081B6D|nr:hypothetical protein [Soonwooa sp.]